MKKPDNIRLGNASAPSRLGLASKPVYAFDIDGVLCNTREVHRAALQESLGVTLKDGGHYQHFGFYHEDPAVLDKIAEVAMDHWRRPSVFANGEASGQHVIEALARKGQFVGYVTRRHPKLEPQTREWLIQRGFPSDEVYFPGVPAADYDLVHPLHHMVGDVESKAAAIRRMGATHFVEDSPHEALAIANDGVLVVVVRRDYNAVFEAEVKRGMHYLAADIMFIDELEELL